MYKSQLINYQDSYNQLNHVMSLLDQTRVNKSLRVFNEEQNHEKDFINELYFKFKNSSPRTFHHTLADSFTMLNAIPPAANQLQLAAYFSAQRGSEMKNSALGKSYDNLYSQANQTTTATPATASRDGAGFVHNHLRSFLSHSRLTDHDLPKSTSQSTTTYSSNEEARTVPTAGGVLTARATFKVGYLLKRSHHSHMKNWLKRRCQSENGFFYIFHSDETKEPVKINLVISNIKVNKVLIYLK
jgi:hypothetical protein